MIETPGGPTLVRIFPSSRDQTEWNDGCTSVSPTLIKSKGRPLVAMISTNGLLQAIDPLTGQVVWDLTLPAPAGQEPNVVATPVQVSNKLVVAYQSTLKGLDARQAHWVVAIDLDKQDVDLDFPPLELHAARPTPDGSDLVEFLPSHALSRSALAHIPRTDNSLGHVYIGFGNAADVEPWHGWLFEVDLDAWRAGGTGHAVSSVFLTTPETECPPRKGENQRCGGGIWSAAGPLVVSKGDEFELLVVTGNGEFNIAQQSFGNTVVRLTKGLRFDPGCHPTRCDGVNLDRPSESCFRTCSNLFVPRLLPNSEPYRFPPGSCQSDSFLQCLAQADYDLGANSPVRVDLKGGPSVIVQPGKDGGVYLFDAEHMGTIYDRQQLVGVCGTAGEDCWLGFAGMIITQPAIAWLDERPIIIVPTFVPDGVQAAGIVALRIIKKGASPRFQVFWRAPDPSTEEARKNFRYYSTRPVVTALGAGKKPYAWVADLHWDPDAGTIYGIRVADGHIVERKKALGRIQRFTRPLVYDGRIYFSACFNDGRMLEAFKIQHYQQILRSGK